MISASMLTFLNKTIYTRYNFNPINLFLVQHVFNTIFCTSLMSYKSLINPNALDWAEKYGIKISTWSEIR